MVGPEGDAGIIPRFCNDLVVRGTSNNDERVRFSCCFLPHTTHIHFVVVQFQMNWHTRPSSGCPIDSYSSLVLILCIPLGQTRAKTLHWTLESLTLLNVNGPVFIVIGYFYLVNYFPTVYVLKKNDSVPDLTEFCPLLHQIDHARTKSAKYNYTLTKQYCC